MNCEKKSNLYIKPTKNVLCALKTRFLDPEQSVQPKKKRKRRKISRLNCDRFMNWLCRIIFEFLLFKCDSLKAIYSNKKIWKREKAHMHWSDRETLYCTFHVCDTKEWSNDMETGIAKHLEILKFWFLFRFLYFDKCVI